MTVAWRAVLDDSQLEYGDRIVVLLDDGTRCWLQWNTSVRLSEWTSTYPAWVLFGPDDIEAFRTAFPPGDPRFPAILIQGGIEMGRILTFVTSARNPWDEDTFAMKESPGRVESVRMLSVVAGSVVTPEVPEISVLGSVSR